MEQVWRPTLVARAGCGGVAAGLIALGVVALVASATQPSGAALGVAALCIAAAALFLLVGFRAFIRVDEQGVTYRNFITTTVVLWQDLRGCTAGYNGIASARQNGTVAVGLAVQRSNLAAWRHLRTRADDVVVAIEQAKQERAP